MEVFIIRVGCCFPTHQIFAQKEHFLFYRDRFYDEVGGALENDIL